jgi:hypothetical protein
MPQAVGSRPPAAGILYRRHLDLTAWNAETKTSTEMFGRERDRRGVRGVVRPQPNSMKKSIEAGFEFAEAIEATDAAGHHLYDGSRAAAGSGAVYAVRRGGERR